MAESLSEQIAVLKTVAVPQARLVTARGDEVLALQTELERAWRAIQGFWTAAKKGEAPSRTMLSYHAPTIGGAIRFAQEGETEGSQFFIGKPPEVLQEVLR